MLLEYVCKNIQNPRLAPQYIPLIGYFTDWSHWDIFCLVEASYGRIMIEPKELSIPYSSLDGCSDKKGT